ncbi:MAG: ABC transporter ATP-binding protein [Mesorhizobium sp.]|nr:MAG: ABC transporter ATP-binding protein [Mesorhizobium sp.]RWH85174.1 MAG: ABC transporter ATP-binding protein [Mesorhizobium sp.]RWH89929.1 MAG: ABC transporter ATP-binding protein [Mesorhizobium sp.]RWH98321.1 MAG: ABC transporter ATP-binding protein [Mesorhizobium sp.]RWI04671.1 MAG: ABC transporter ATP-binding protein [Mesorhizobium sp.]
MNYRPDEINETVSPTAGRRQGLGERLVSLSALRKTYRTEHVETTALDEVDLAINRAEFLAVMGPSGCGKSTLLNVIGMIDSPTGGRYVFNGTDISDAPERQLVDLRKKSLGFIFQSFNLIDELSVAENVELPLLYCGVPPAERRLRVRDVLELVDLKARARHKPSQLSGGQQQRVAIARAVVNDPKLILADEPTGNLDSKNGADVMDMLRILHEQGATIVMVTHSLSDAERAQRIVNMLDGRIVGEKRQRTGEQA